MKKTFELEPVQKRSWVSLLLICFAGLAVTLVVLWVDPDGQAESVRWIVGPVIVISILVWLVILRGLWRMKVQIESEQLVLSMLFYRRKRNIAELDLDSARILDLDKIDEYKPRIRTNGISLPGLRIGNYSSRMLKGKRLFCMLTRFQRVLVLPDRDGKRAILLSPKRPQAMLDALRKAAR